MPRTQKGNSQHSGSMSPYVDKMLSSIVNGNKTGEPDDTSLESLWNLITKEFSKISLESKDV